MIEYFQDEENHFNNRHLEVDYKVVGPQRSKLQEYLERMGKGGSHIDMTLNQDTIQQINRIKNID